MKVILISDTHGREPELPSGDLLIHAGDWSGRGSFKETNDFLTWMHRISPDYKKIICVPGNHDRWVEENLPLAKEEFKKHDIELLVDSWTIFERQLIYGMPWTPEFGRWSFMGNDIERANYCQAIPPDTSILVTHGPPQGYLDKLAINGSNPGEHVGCQFLKQAILRIEPTLHVFGHIHEQSGMQTVNRTLLVNASHMDEYYRPVNGFKVVYI